MAAIRGKDTKPEMIIRRAIHAHGLRFVLHSAKVRGRPDLVLPKWRAVILVHGCFWHRHGCSYFRLPTTRRRFWQEKLERNRLRDESVIRELRADGWRVAIVWECAMRDRSVRQIALMTGRLSKWVKGRRRTIEIMGPP
jgi:DNA mismatch endonuclease (patch repair protein)